MPRFSDARSIPDRVRRELACPYAGIRRAWQRRFAHPGGGYDELPLVQRVVEHFAHRLDAVADPEAALLRLDAVFAGPAESDPLFDEIDRAIERGEDPFTDVNH